MPVRTQSLLWLCHAFLERPASQKLNDHLSQRIPDICLLNSENEVHRPQRGDLEKKLRKKGRKKSVSNEENAKEVIRMFSVVLRQDFTV